MIKDVDTANTRWHVFDSGDKGVDSTPLLFVHGFPLDHQMWKHQLNYFGSKRRVICPDLPGFGQSQLLAAKAETSMDWFADQLSELLSQLNVSKVDFCGLSMGGYIGWQFWKKYQRQLGKLIACDTRAVADTPEVARGRQMMAASIGKQGTKSMIEAGFLEKLFGQPALDSPECRETKEVILSSPTSSVAAAQLGMAARPDVSSWLPKINVPTLVICGSHDVISPVEEMRTIANQIPGAKFEEIEDSGHMAPLEKPQEVNRAIDSFLTAV